MFTSGYSTTTLAKKLGIKELYNCLFYNQPKYYFSLFSDFPNNIILLESIKPETVDFIHLFCITEKELKEVVKKYKPALKKEGLLWISWPKGSSKIETDLKRDLIREYTHYI